MLHRPVESAAQSCRFKAVAKVSPSERRSRHCRALRKLMSPVRSASTDKRTFKARMRARRTHPTHRGDSGIYASTHTLQAAFPKSSARFSLYANGQGYESSPDLPDLRINQTKGAITQPTTPSASTMGIAMLVTTRPLLTISSITTPHGCWRRPRYHVD